jgi:CBS domain-containing protein
MKVKDVMEPNPITIPVSATYEEVAKILYTHGISGAPVIDENGELIGMVSEKDLFRILYPYYRSYYETPVSYTDMEDRENKLEEVKDKKVDVYMTKILVTIEPDAPVMRAGAIMLAKQIHRLPVVENGKMVGIISRRLIYRTILRHRLGL